MREKLQTIKQKGITLIALVITIMILIILSTIAINMTFGDNGLVERAEQAKNMTEEAARKEQEDLANTAAYINEVIYGSGSSGQTPSTNEEPVVNEEPIINEVEPDTNSVDTNTVEPPPVEIPDAEGEIQFGEIVWSGGQASVSISTDSGYEIEYQKNGTTGSWTKHTSGEILEGLNHGNIIYVRLTDGENVGKETSIRITDGTAPQVTVIPGTITSSTIKVEVEAIDNESGMADTVTYTYYIKKTSETDTAYVNKGSNTNANYTFTGLEQGTSYDIKVETVGDKAGNKGEGTLSSQSTVSIPGGETGLEEGAIAFGSPTWSGGTASIAVSTNTTGYTIEYQVSTGEPVEESWQEIANKGTVNGINHNETVYARLTDGTNYGEYASATITDTAGPVVEITQGEVTSNSIAVTVNAVDNETGLAEADTYKYYLNEEQEAKETSTNNTYTYTGLTAETPYSIKVEVTDKAGNVGTQTTSISTIEKIGINAGEISQAPTEYYGAEVKGYECTSNGVSKWRIYYADDTNIYLIADDYISYEYTPDGQVGSTIYKNGTDYKLSFNNIVNDYTGASDISTNSKGSKWLSQYLSSYGTSTNINIKAVAYMMDTNVWDTFAGEYAEYAMGGPTIEMFCASYEDTHPSKYVQYNVTSQNGYGLKWNSDSAYSSIIEGLPLGDFNEIYVKSDSTKASGMWIASPSGQDDTMPMHTETYGGEINYSLDGYRNTHRGFRPIICLKSDVQLKKLDDGSFIIVESKLDQLPVIDDIIGGEIIGDTTTVKDSYYNQIVIPGGFKVAQDSGTSVEDGIVIEDSEGNQFVWIPTGTYQTSSGEKTNELTRRTFTSTGATPVSGDSVINSYFYGEGDSRSIAHATIGNFLNSAKPVAEGGHGGFYIGRYEQGVGNVCKEGINPYNSVPIDEAKAQAEEMYNGKEEIKATNELISSYAWDTALNFICQNSQYGYELATTTSSSRGNINTSNDSIAQTGRTPADCYSNIYDLLGNCHEWTTEYSNHTYIGYEFSCVSRGGTFGSYYYHAASRNNNYFEGESGIDVSFRIQLYV